jgi:Secretion system C-terminal sorting domain
MKSLKIFMILIGIIVSLSSASACGNNVEHCGKPIYTICDSAKVTWDATSRKFTINLSKIKSSLQEPSIIYKTGDTCSTCNVDLCPHGTYIPGATTFSSLQLDPKYGNPLKNGANGLSHLIVELKTLTNDCGLDYEGTSLRTDCTPTYCDNYNATFNGSTINVSGINNCSPGNFFMIANADFSKWQVVSIKVDSTDIDKGSADVSKLQFYKTTELVYPYAKEVMFLMNSDDLGGNRLYCSKSFSPYTQNSLYHITTNNITIAPNPASPSETITIKGEYTSDAKVSITSVGGAMVESVTPSVGADAITVPLSGLNLQAGIYFIRIESGEKVFSGKLCVK